MLDRTEGFVEAISFLAEKKNLPYCFTHQLYVCLFLSEDSAFGFYSNSYRLVACSLLALIYP